MPRKETVKELSAAATGVGVGAALGSGIGIAAGAIGAFSGVVPLALIVGATFWGGAKILNQHKENKRLKSAINEEISKTL